MADNPLLAWVDRPRSDHAIRFGTAEGWDRQSYPALAARVRSIAAGLAGIGVGPDDRVVLVQRGPDFVTSFFATMLAGAIPCPLAPPLLLQDADHYATHVHAIAESARPTVVLTAPDLVQRMVGLMPTDLRIAVSSADQIVASGGSGAGRSTSATALIQFTSGSSGTPRGVRVPVAALAANLAAIRDWLAMTPDDPTASWLPVHHDMGLIGCLLAPVVVQSDLWQLRPEQFVREPARYLRCFGESGARLTAMPAFGLDHIVRRVRSETLAGSDFSQWRAVIVGAERVEAAVLERFADLLAPFGFHRRALLPAYGLAEATLAVTGLDLRSEFRTCAVDPRVAEFGEPVIAGDEDGPSRMVGCGSPLAGVTVEIVDYDGSPLPERTLGEIVVGGPSVAGGYVEGTAGPSHTHWRTTSLHTGDAGFLADGQLHVVGRIGDSMKIRGRVLFAEDVEAALVHAGIPRSRLAVLLGATAAGPTVVALIEHAENDWLQSAQRVLLRMTEGANCLTRDVARQSILRTTSGKPRRSAMWLDALAVRGTPVGRSN